MRDYLIHSFFGEPRWMASRAPAWAWENGVLGDYYLNQVRGPIGFPAPLLLIRPGYAYNAGKYRPDPKGYGDMLGVEFFIGPDREFPEVGDRLFTLDHRHSAATGRFCWVGVIDGQYREVLAQELQAHGGTIPLAPGATPAKPYAWGQGCHYCG